MPLMAAPGGRLRVQNELVSSVGREGTESTVTELSRFDFYDEGGEAYLVLMTGESRAYGNLIVRKGVVV